MSRLVKFFIEGMIAVFLNLSSIAKKFVAEGFVDFPKPSLFIELFSRIVESISPVQFMFFSRISVWY